MTYDLHVGMHSDTAQEARLEFVNYGFHRHFAPLYAMGLEAVHVDGDGWNSWGEAPGTDVNDDLTQHVVFRFGANPEQVRDEALDWVRENYTLEPMGGLPQQHYVEAVITDSDNWGALNGDERGTWSYLAPCAWCDRYVMDEDADPNAVDICMDCSERALEPDRDDVVVEFRLTGDARDVDDALSAMRRALESSKAEVAYYREG